MANKMRDRLKENISIIRQHNERGSPVKHITKGQKYEVEVIAEIVEDVSLIIEKMENKRLTEIPCAIGDIVYVPWTWGDAKGIATVSVDEIKLYDKHHHTMFFIDMGSDNEDFNQCYGGWKLDVSIGKTVFLTKAEAEQKLNEIRKEGADNG